MDLSGAPDAHGLGADSGRRFWPVSTMPSIAGTRRAGRSAIFGGMYKVAKDISFVPSDIAAG